MANVLYISMTGMTEALGESQVVQYLIDLAKKNSVSLLSFEKPTSTEKYNRMQQIMKNASIKWYFFEYSNRFGVFSSAWQIILAFFLLLKVIKQQQIEIIHARSLIPALIGVLLKKIFDVKLLFDIRGFAIDEKIMEGRLKPNAILTRILKKIENDVYKNSDQIVTLTHASKPIIETVYHVDSSLITVIPTCANLALFNPISADEKFILREKMGYSENDIIILHNGSLNSWVDFEAEIKLFEQIAFLEKNAKFLFLNKGQHDLINDYLKKSTLDKSICRVLSAEFDQISQYLNIADVCVFFIKPSFAKKASAPTKFAELVACHLLSITNTNYGDMDFYIKKYHVGCVLELDEVHANPKNAAIACLTYLSNHNNNLNNSENFTRLFSEHFSKEIAIQRYQHIYNLLSKGNHENIVTSQI